MHSILPKQIIESHSALILQKDKLKSQLTHATYQAFIDKSKIQHGLEEISVLKNMILNEIKILHQGLLAKKDKIQRIYYQRNRSLQQLRSLGLEIVKQEQRMQDIIESSIKQQQDNKTLSSNLTALKIDCNNLKQSKNQIIQKIEDSKRKVNIAQNNIKDIKNANDEIRFCIQQTNSKNKTLNQEKVNLAFQIQRTTLTTEKIKSDVDKIISHNEKLKANNTKVNQGCIKYSSQIVSNKRLSSQLQQKLTISQLNFTQKLNTHQSNKLQNQILSKQNYRLYQQNKTLVLQQVSDKQVLYHLQQNNIRLKAFLTEKQILNKQTQSVLLMPHTTNYSKISELQELNSKLLGSTGSGFN